MRDGGNDNAGTDIENGNADGGGRKRSDTVTAAKDVGEIVNGFVAR